MAIREVKGPKQDVDLDLHKVKPADVGGVGAPAGEPVDVGQTTNPGTLQPVKGFAKFQGAASRGNLGYFTPRGVSANPAEYSASGVKGPLATHYERIGENVGDNNVLPVMDAAYHAVMGSDE